MTPIRLALPAFAAAAFLAMPAFAAEPLALKRVLLSTGGVGYFEYEAKVTGNETLDLAVPLDQVDDVMKSIVVYDDKGGIGEISLPGREPLAAAFREMPFGPEALASPADLLNALRGAEVRVEGARGVSGRILSVVPETAKDKDDAQITRHRVSLMTTGGVRQFLLEEADGLQFADPALQAKLDAALAALARDSAKDRRTLAIRATGDGERTLRVGYVVEAPLWKTSYRLTLAADPKAETAALQGWAVLENMSGADWDGVDLTVVSGNPVTFRQALYQSYTVARPEVPVEVAGRVLPPVDERARDADGEGRGDAAASGAAPPAPMAMMDRMMAAPAEEAIVAQAYAGQPQGLAKVTAAESGETATQVTFRLPEPVTVAAGHSLLVPIIDREIPAGRVDLYLPQTEPKHPLAAVDLKNDGQTGLPPGVLTLYERGADGVSYVGDARLGALPAGETRLVSFAVDQKVTVDREDKRDDTLARARIVDGVLELTTTQRASVTYAVTGAAGEDRTVLLQTPRYEGWTLTEPAQGLEKKGVEIVAGQYRIRQAVAAGKTETVTVTQEQPLAQSIDLAEDADDQIAAWAEDRTLPAKVRQAMAELAGQLAVIRDHEAEAGRLDQRQGEIAREQARLRQNIGAVPKDSDLFQRYLGKLNDSESELEQVGTDLAKARKAVDTARAAFRQSVRKLNI
ncbi:hypothetical protein QFZ27_003804 [Inquilinus ginsengisoli]|uniref:DUF4139 domain-containing protein n=1 Tax=Inquilinus ginsengisoli TaxID=363840 RepID=UPI003D19AB56